MTVFDLLFIVLFLLTCGSLITAAVRAGMKQRARAGRILYRVLLGAVAYMAVVIFTSLTLPRRVLGVGEPQCFDDWCIAVTGYRQAPAGSMTSFDVSFRVWSRARRAPQREKNMVAYLSGPQGQRWDALPDSNQAGFDVTLAPEESKTISRSFRVPPNATGLGVVVRHEGGFPIGWFIVGYDTWFRKPPITFLR